MLSYMVGVLKNCKDFTHFVTYNVYKSKHQEKILSVEKDSIEFEVKVIVKL
jgi:hypothetical protein